MTATHLTTRYLTPRHLTLRQTTKHFNPTLLTPRRHILLMNDFQTFHSDLFNSLTFYSLKIERSQLSGNLLVSLSLWVVEVALFLSVLAFLAHLMALSEQQDLD